MGLSHKVGSVKVGLDADVVVRQMRAPALA
jgi:cytosine/adenosine deaminase-related metal-dependent hydrolase